MTDAGKYQTATNNGFLAVGGKIAEQYGKRKGGDPEFIGISAFRSIIGV